MKRFHPQVSVRDGKPHSGQAFIGAGIIAIGAIGASLAGPILGEEKGAEKKDAAASSYEPTASWSPAEAGGDLYLRQSRAAVQEPLPGYDYFLVESRIGLKLEDMALP